jgi:phage terminase large subunit-like protein
MVGDRRGRLVDALRSARLLSDRVTARPLDYIRWTPPQAKWLQSPHKRKLLRAGNQVGKTWAGMAEVIYRATGTHPYYTTKPPPVEIWIVCTTFPQSVFIMKKFWQLVPKHLIRNTSCDPRYGFGKDNPAVVFQCGSVVRFKTTNQGAEAMAGATVDYVLIDEPTSEDIYRELDRRLTRTGGDLGLTLTPVNRPVEYLRQLVRDDIVEDIHARLTVENLTPLGDAGPLRLLDGTPMDDSWIAEQRRTVLPRFAPVVLDGEWEFRLEGSVFSSFDVESHVTDALPRGEIKVCMGFDHGEGDFREVAILAAVDDSGEFPRVHFLAEYASDGASLPETDAKETLKLLQLYGWTWRKDHVAYAVGDRPSIGRIGGVKSNAELAKAIARELRRRGQLPARALIDPQIWQAKTGKGGNTGSVWTGVEWLHRAMLRPGHFTVHPRCARLIESFQKWDGSDNEWKDACDAARYATWPFAMRRRSPQLASMPRVEIG